MAKSKLKPSSLALRKGETAENTKGTRTSSGTFVSGSEDETGTLHFIEKKIAKATMIPLSHGEKWYEAISNLDVSHGFRKEAFNILRYEIGQKYDSHYDAFNPDEYGPQSSQRAASFLLYLSNVEEGGETVFPFENDSAVSSGFDYKQCVGLKVKPRQGDGLLFYSLFPNGTIDRLDDLRYMIFPSSAHFILKELVCGGGNDISSWKLSSHQRGEMGGNKVD
ncbi:hypothetical protein OIU77_028746 [Salix suchowensis]|uniref:Prolyl 4-hydroxylase alpha subunit domain-containing protein n=1 Tax=Salix suchowensis TaxID=1278906 RepID=A0ABQ9BIF7_9ROSI|nr:hypothetical protein OIU77_028746 [Salix suchowensis]